MKETKQLRKERILDAAFQVFIESGYTHAKMSDIAARAGYGKSTLYEYFKSKDEIFEQLLQFKAVDAYYAIGEAAERETCASAKIRSFISQEIDMYLEYSHCNDIVPVIMTNPEFMAKPILFEVVRFVLRYRFENIARWIGEGLASGEFSGTDRNVAATAVMGAVAALGTSLAQTHFPPTGTDLTNAGAEPVANAGAGVGNAGAEPVANARTDITNAKDAKEALFRFIFAGLGMKPDEHKEENNAWI